MGINDPSAPPKPAPKVLNSAWLAGSPESKETRPTIIGPSIGILLANPLTAGIVAFNAGDTDFAAGPNILEANPLTLPATAPTPLERAPTPLLIILPVLLSKPPVNLFMIPNAPLIIFLARLKAPFILDTIALNIFSPINFHAINPLIKFFKLSIKILNFSNPSSPKRFFTKFWPISTNLYPKSISVAKILRTFPEKSKNPSTNAPILGNAVCNFGKKSTNLTITYPKRILDANFIIELSIPPPGNLSFNPFPLDSFGSFFSNSFSCSDNFFWSLASFSSSNFFFWKATELPKRVSTDIIDVFIFNAKVSAESPAFALSLESSVYFTIAPAGEGIIDVFGVIANAPPLSSPPPMTCCAFCLRASVFFFLFNNLSVAIFFAPPLSAPPTVLSANPNAIILTILIL